VTAGGQMELSFTKYSCTKYTCDGTRIVVKRE
jgi:hypothetical protein